MARTSGGKALARSASSSWVRSSASSVDAPCSHRPLRCSTWSGSGVGGSRVGARPAVRTRRDPSSPRARRRTARVTAGPVAGYSPRGRAPATHPAAPCDRACRCLEASRSE
eukprot:scaffold66306_cov39-Phaeocystis_antarctica.AAC.2